MVLNFGLLDWLLHMERIKMLDLQCRLIRTCLTYDAPADPEGHSLPDTWRRS